MDDPTIITIYTDGGCDNRPGYKTGGWGAILYHDGAEKRICGGVRDTTSNRMELQAAINALSALKRKDLEIHLHSDSQYLIKGMNEWRHSWICKNWIGSTGKPVINRDLWQLLIKLDKKYNVKWVWVRGHAGHPMQEIAHCLATEGIGKIK